MVVGKGWHITEKTLYITSDKAWKDFYFRQSRISDITEFKWGPIYKDCFEIFRTPWDKYINNIDSINISAKVNTIGKCGFMNLRNVNSIILPDSITEIGDFAFKNCINLESVAFPKRDNIKVHNWIFENCKNMHNFTISEKLLDKLTTDFDFSGFCFESKKLSINGRTGDYILNKAEDTIITYCGDEQNIKIPANIKYIANSAFRNNQNIKTLDLSNTYFIGNYAFGSCRNLQTIKFSENLESMARSFIFCNKLETVILPPNLNLTPDNNTFGLWQSFKHCHNLKTAVLSEGINEIIWYTFADCINLEDVIIPDSVEEISCNVFSGCKNLKKIRLPQNLKELGKDVFCDCKKLKTIEVSNKSYRLIKYNLPEDCNISISQ